MFRTQIYLLKRFNSQIHSTSFKHLQVYRVSHELMQLMHNISKPQSTDNVTLLIILLLFLCYKNGELFNSKPDIPLNIPLTHCQQTSADQQWSTKVVSAHAPFTTRQYGQLIAILPRSVRARVFGPKCLEFSLHYSLLCPCFVWLGLGVNV